MNKRTSTAAEPARITSKHGSLPIPPGGTALKKTLQGQGAAAETGTIADTRARFGIPRSTLYRLAAAGHVRMLKLGRTTLVDFASVRAFLASAPAAALNSPDHLNDATPRG